MEYRGKQYTVVQGVGPDSWRWTVHLDEKTIKSGQATSRSAAMTSVVWLIDKALEPKKVTQDAPSGERGRLNLFSHLSGTERRLLRSGVGALKAGG